MRSGVGNCDAALRIECRQADATHETRILLQLQRDLAVDPAGFFQKLVDAALAWSNVDSTWMLTVEPERQAVYLVPPSRDHFKLIFGEGTPSDFGPCGTVLERNATQLMLHPERHFTYLQPIQPSLEEVLLVPFHIDGKAVGTIWAVIHDPTRHFDGEDKRLLENSKHVWYSPRIGPSLKSAYWTLCCGNQTGTSASSTQRHLRRIYPTLPELSSNG